jgi:hypothetical protein
MSPWEKRFVDKDGAVIIRGILKVSMETDN